MTTAHDILHDADLYRAAYPGFGAPPGPDSIPRAEAAPQAEAGHVQGPAEATIEDLSDAVDKAMAAGRAGADAADVDAAWRTTYAAVRSYVRTSRAELEADIEMEAGA